MNRRQAREDAFKLLFQNELNEQELIEKKHMNSFTSRIVTGVLKQQVNLDEHISKHLKNWTFDRIAPVEKTILRIAILEILHMEDIPAAVSINEAVDLAHLYGDEKSSKFINGVLSKIN